MTCLVFKTTCIDREKPLCEGAFFFTRRTLFPPLDKRNTRDKAKGLCITSERHIPQCWMGTRCCGQWFIRRHIASFRERERIGKEGRYLLLGILLWVGIKACISSPFCVRLHYTSERNPSPTRAPYLRGFVVVLSFLFSYLFLPSLSLRCGAPTSNS